MKKPSIKKSGGTARGTTLAEFRKIALGFPEANEKPSYGKPAYFIAKKFFTRHRAEDNSIVMIVDGMHTRDMMLELDPKTYFITEHYRDYPSVLVRMERVSPAEVRIMLERRWRKIAPKKLVKQIDGVAAPAKTVAKRAAGRRKPVPKKAKR